MAASVKASRVLTLWQRKVSVNFSDKLLVVPVRWPDPATINQRGDRDAADLRIGWRNSVSGNTPSALPRMTLTPSEAAELSKLVEGFVRSLEITDLAERIAKKA